MILVTGANGFIGRALCKRLLADGWQVRGAIRSADQAAQLPPGLDPVGIGEVGPNTDWTGALTGIETVVHLAARVHVMDGTTGDSSEAHRLVNLAGTERLARQAAEQGVRRIVFLSTVKVHGEESSIPYDETAPCRPWDPYGASKWEAEKILRAIGRESGLEVVILRPPLVYGASVKANVLSLMTVIQRGIPLPLASVDNRRSLICLGNLTDAIAACVANKKAAGRTFLVSDDEDVSTPELIRKIASSLERPARLVPFPVHLLRLIGRLTGRSRTMEKVVGSLVVDIGKIRRELNWKPPYTMEEGLKDTADWFRANSNVRRRSGILRYTMKRLFDIVMALCSSVVFFLPLLIIALWVKSTSKGPVLYWSDRVGKNNTIFRMPKFRTMKTDTPAVATHLLSDPDRYLTPIGIFLRKSSLDELPQLISIVKGDMSFVGPRPALFNQEDLITLRTQKGIHELVPGLTGWAQINGRDELPIPVKVELDDYYRKHRSFRLDMEILFKTIITVLLGKGITH